MSRIRTIKPEFWQHEELSKLPADTHILAAALLNYADDDGYFNANPKLVKSACLPLREDSVSTHDSLASLVDIGFIRVGTGADGKRYGHIVNFLQHQKVSHPTPSKISKLQIKWEFSNNSILTLNDSSGDSPEELQSVSALNRIELNGIEGNRTLSQDNVQKNTSEEKNEFAERVKTMNQKFAIGTISHFGRFRELYPKPGNWLEAEIAWRQQNCDAVAEIIFTDIPKRLAEHSGWKQGLRWVLNPENYLKRREWENAILPESERQNPGGAIEWAQVGTLTGKR